MPSLSLSEKFLHGHETEKGFKRIAKQMDMKHWEIGKLSTSGEDCKQLHTCSGQAVPNLAGMQAK